MQKLTQNLFKTADSTNYFKPFALITLLFLLWGFAHGLLDVLDKHFQDGSLGFVKPRVHDRPDLAIPVD